MKCMLLALILLSSTAMANDKDQTKIFGCAHGVKLSETLSLKKTKTILTSILLDEVTSSTALVIGENNSEIDEMVQRLCVRSNAGPFINLDDKVRQVVQIAKNKSTPELLKQFGIDPNASLVFFATNEQVTGQVVDNKLTYFLDGSYKFRDVDEHGIDYFHIEILFLGSDNITNDHTSNN